MIRVPEEFRQRHPFPYPPDNKIIFEEWLYNMLAISPRKATPRVYLPIFWTAYLVRADFGKHKGKLGKLQTYVNSLSPNIKYWTVVQYDDGPVVDMSHLDCKFFAMSGPKIDYPLPLIGRPHTVEVQQEHRPYLFNFIGRVTHPLRKELMETLSNQSDGYISTKDHNIQQYCDILSKSVFTLCPRGYGQTSFRISEALQYGSIPVYISDDFIIPYNHNFCDYGLTFSPGDLQEVLNTLRDFPRDTIKNIQSRIPSIYYSLFTYEGCSVRILKELHDEGLDNSTI